MKSRSIKTKLVVAVGICFFLVIALIIGYTSISMYQDVSNIAKKHAKEVAGKYSTRIDKKINTALDAARILAQTLSTVKDSETPLEIGREQVNGILKNILRENEMFFGVYTLWEPDAFDQKDAAHVNLAGHDETGRFIPYWVRGANGIVVEPLIGYESEGMGDYYQIPKKTRNEVIIEPYKYLVEGKEVLITSLVVPIIREGKFYGIAGIDILLDTIQEMVSAVDLYEGQAEINIISNGGKLVAVSDRPEYLGQHMKKIRKNWQEDLGYIKAGQDVMEEDEGRYALFMPIIIGKTTTPWSVNVNIPRKLIFADANRHVLIVVISGIVLTIISLLFTYFVIGRLIHPLLKLTNIANNIACGDLEYEQIETANDEIGQVLLSFEEVIKSFGEITEVCKAVAGGDFSKTVTVRGDKDILGESVNQMGRTLSSVVKQTNRIAEGDYSRDITPQSDDDELGIALADMTVKLRETIAENTRENWFKTGAGRLNDRMRGEQKTVDLAQRIVGELAKYLDAQIGTIYLNDSEDSLKMVGSYAFTNRKGISNEFKFGEGLVGQAAIEKKSIVVTDVPDDYMPVTSGTGRAKAKNIVVVPLLYEDEVAGAIEFGSFHEFSGDQLEFIENCAESIAIAINSANSRTKMAELLEQTQRQSEELERQQEELRATNGELEKQAETLKSSEEHLRAQQEELETSNSELEIKTAELEAQKDQITKAKNEVDIKAKELEIASKYKSEFLSNMSHELRTPLNSLLILSKIFMENGDGNLTEGQIQSAQVIYQSGADLLSLINEILDLSKIEAGKMDLNIEETDIAELEENIKENFSHVAENKGVELIVNVSEELPKTITTDAKRFQQVIRNFLSNAFKFTEQGSVTVSFERPGESVKLSHSGLKHSEALAIAVTDTGIGIPDDKQKVIFEAFQQADGSTSRKYGGTGLGLSISRELARFLGGEIQLTSQQGQGSTFTLYIPELLQKSAISSAVQTTPKAKIVNKDLPKRQDMICNSEITEKQIVADDREDINADDKVILIIEDDPNFAKILVDMSREKGFKCLATDSGEMGLKFANDFDVSAILLDIGLPDMSGIGVIDALKENFKTRHIPVHFISAQDSDMISDTVHRKGAIGYLTKPASKEQLDGVFSTLENFITTDIRKLLIAEDDENTRISIMKLIDNDDVDITVAETGQKAYDLLKSETFDCMVLDLGLPDMSGFELLNQMKNDALIATKPPVIVYTGRELSREEDAELKEYAGSVIVKGVESPERLLDETSLFLHRMEKSLPQEQQKMVKLVHDKDSVLTDKKIMVVDDDMRNVFALSHALKAKGMKVIAAENGQKALDMLNTEQDIDMVLMDIMMPVMNGYETMRRIREDKRFWKLPILALTAKAMSGDREKCIEAGANDYLTKPIDIEKVLSMLRVWLYLN